MKSRAIITLGVLFVSLSTFADTCPPVKGLDPVHPPAGWDSGPSPYQKGLTYAFGVASHVFIANQDYQKIYCRYETCPGLLCPAFLLVSAKTYARPPFEQNPPAPWNALSNSKYLISCRPGDQDPSHCVFD